MVQFSMNELMIGTHHFVDPKTGPTDDSDFYFKLNWGQELFSFVRPGSQDFFKAKAKGVINIAGLTNGEVPTEGTLELLYFTEQKLRYTLKFSVKGKDYTYIGEKKDVKLWRPLCLVKTHTTCYGKVFDENNQIISHSVTHFEMEPKNIVNFVGSLRVGLG